MRGLVLEGGGARGAYHIGVAKALFDNGYNFDGYTGTSIGAINAAALAQDDFKLAFDLWRFISMEQVFDIDDSALFELSKITKLHFDKQLTQRVKNAITRIIGNRGINTDVMKAFLDSYIDENKIRKSGKDFGLITVSVSERKPYELMLEDIPNGKLLNYIMASASFPGFKPEEIDGKIFIDGAFYDNCPVNLLLKRGYDSIIAVRTNAPGVIRKPDDSEKVRYISPSKDLGNLMWFNSENSNRNIELGYNDAVVYLKTHTII